ncbi:hypothetical protein [Allorhizocola rhizosphaerae]|uniref:hypothetical protein n=1 Tax=Allorhizocola rhizosphaerae TaxID=1872709 RepID=UPI000E3C267E|nr:hypothetical protein [Allorhizocola rhizosphaerae]
MTFDDLSAFYAANQPVVIGLGALAGVAVLLLAANRLRKMKEHRATLLVANILTIVAAALATAVSASGMWKFFTDILGESPLRYAFFWFIEIALFASALLARSRLLRDPEKGTTGVDGIAVWVLAGLTATLSALDSDSFREVCLRLVAPLVAAWMWERALAAERNVRLGKTVRRINWTLTPERIFVWLRLAEAGDRDVSEVDRARRRAKLGQARLHLHLLQTKKSFAWRVRRAHRTVIRQAMAAAEHIGLADFPDATNEREAMQMYMATLYGFVDATSPQAVAHLNAWQAALPPRHTAAVAVPAAGLRDTDETEDSITAGFANGVNGTEVFAGLLGGLTVPEDAWRTTHPLQGGLANGRSTLAGTAEPESIAQERDAETSRRRHYLDTDTLSRVDLGGEPFQTTGPPATQVDGTHEPEPDDELDDRPDDEADLTAVEAMRRFWESEVAGGRVPTGAELSRAAGVPPTTGLGRRKRREWETELPEHFKAAAGLGRWPAPQSAVRRS